MSRLNFSMNRGTIMGRLTADPRTFKDGEGASFSVVTDHWNTKTKASEATFWNVVFFGDTAGKLAANVGKGDVVCAEGRVYVDAYEGEKGTRYNLGMMADVVVPSSWRGTGSSKKKSVDDFEFDD